MFYFDLNLESYLLVYITKTWSIINLICLSDTDIIDVVNSTEKSEFEIEAFYFVF